MAFAASSERLGYETGIVLNIDGENDNHKESQGHVAEDIIQTARLHGVPIRQDPQLIEALANFDVTGHIPHELYTAVAEILTFLQRLEATMK